VHVGKNALRSKFTEFLTPKISGRGQVTRSDVIRYQQGRQGSFYAKAPSKKADDSRFGHSCWAVRIVVSQMKSKN
jgi:hypothetical protein